MEEKTMQENVLQKIEDKIKQIISEEEVETSNVDLLYKLVDIHKDIKNEEYWKIKEDKYEIRKL